jgi:hypothetical protein
MPLSNWPEDLKLVSPAVAERPLRCASNSRGGSHLLATTALSEYNRCDHCERMFPTVDGGDEGVAMKRIRSVPIVIGVMSLLLSLLTLGCMGGDEPMREPTALPPTANRLPLATKGPAEHLVQPADLHYLGAFRLPGGDARPETFAYGGNAMAFNPRGDPSGPDDGFPGSLFLTGHDRMAYGELPDGSQVSEVSIPVPIASDHLSDLGQADFLQGFHNVAHGFFAELDEIPRVGMQFLDTPATGAKIHLAWGQHLQLDPPISSHAWFDPNLLAPDIQGSWFIGSQSPYSVNGYMSDIPASWADEHAKGRYLATGRFRDGGWSGMGPALYAYQPWIDDNGIPAPSGTHLEETVLLHYESSANTSGIERCLDGYQHPDEWEGGAC